MATPDPLGSDLLDGLAELPIDELRARRAACQALEGQLSYVRRLAQGRLDIASHELAVRRDGGDAGDLVAGLTAALADHITSPGTGHLTSAVGPGEVDDALMASLDAVAEPGRLADPTSMSEDELRAAADGLASFERELSSRRRAMFDRIDALQAELVRRYRTGEATVDGLLQR